MATTTVELTLQRARDCPSSFFTDMSQACVSLGVEKFDMYGDFGEDASTSWLRQFEAHVKGKLAKEDAIFVISGGMAQAMAAKIYESKNHSNGVICHHSSHIVLHENNAYTTLLQMRPHVIGPSSSELIQQPMRYEDVAALLDANPPPAMLFVECPHREIGGKCTSWNDLLKMSRHCRRRGVAFHCDGARIWEAEAYYCDNPHETDETTGQGPKNLAELCAIFNSIYVSFYKGIGGITGAMLLGPKWFVDEARVWQRRFGGNLFCQLPMGVSCWHGVVNSPVEVFCARRRRCREVVQLLTTHLIAMAPPSDTSTTDSSDSCNHDDTHPTDLCQGRFSSVICFDPPVPCVSLVHIYLFGFSEAQAVHARNQTTAETNISVFSRIRPARNVPESMKLKFGEGKVLFIELSLGPLNSSIPDEVWLRGWESFLMNLTE